MAMSIKKNENFIKENKALEILKLGDKFELIRSQTRIKKRDMNDLAILEAKVKKYQKDIQFVNSRIESEKLQISKPSLFLVPK